jgi:hypothetical protein
MKKKIIILFLLVVHINSDAQPVTNALIDSPKVLKPVYVKRKRKKIKYPKFNLLNRYRGYRHFLKRNVAFYINKEKLTKDIYGFRVKYPYNINFTDTDVPIKMSIFLLRKDSSVQKIISKFDTLKVSDKIYEGDIITYISSQDAKKALGVLIVAENILSNKEGTISMHYTAGYRKNYTYEILTNHRGIVPKNIWNKFALELKLDKIKLLNWSIKVEVIHLG